MCLINSSSEALPDLFIGQRVSQNPRTRHNGQLLWGRFQSRQLHLWLIPKRDSSKDHKTLSLFTNCGFASFYTHRKEFIIEGRDSCCRTTRIVQIRVSVLEVWFGWCCFCRGDSDSSERKKGRERFCLCVPLCIEQERERHEWRKPLPKPATVYFLGLGLNFGTLFTITELLQRELLFSPPLLLFKPRKMFDRIMCYLTPRERLNKESYKADKPYFFLVNYVFKSHQLVWYYQLFWIYDDLKTIYKI